MAVSDDISDLEDGQRGFLLTGKESFLEPCVRARAEVGRHLAELQRRSAGDPRTFDILDRLVVAKELTVELADRIIAI
jgi:CHASE3 domain sensor protein